MLPTFIHGALDVKSHFLAGELCSNSYSPLTGVSFHKGNKDMPRLKQMSDDTGNTGLPLTRSMDTAVHACMPVMPSCDAFSTCGVPSPAAPAVPHEAETV